jgi:hypothetical protein
MAKKTYTLNVQVAVPDKTFDKTVVKDAAGNILCPASKGKRYFLPGEPVELDEVEGDALLEKYGPYVAPRRNNGLFEMTKDGMSQTRF